VKDEDPGEIWADLSTLDRYTLQGVVMALAALVPVDQPDVTRWLSTLAPRQQSDADRPEAGVARGLALLVPTRETFDRAMADAGRAPDIAEASG